MIEWINIKLGTRFWYSVRIIYWIDGRRIFYFNRQIGITRKSNILNQRNVASTFHNDIYNKKTKQYLNNGYVSHEISGYLGWFKK